MNEILFVAIYESVTSTIELGVFDCVNQFGDTKWFTFDFVEAFGVNQKL